jgi:NADPH2:quinone reductase
VTALLACRGYTIQLAKADGLTVLADVAPWDEKLVRSLGADVVVDRSGDVAVAIRSQLLDGMAAS